MLTALAGNDGKTKTQTTTKNIAMPNSSAAFIGAELPEQLERHRCDSRENLVQLLNR